MSPTNYCTRNCYELQFFFEKYELQFTRVNTARKIAGWSQLGGRLDYWGHEINFLHCLISTEQLIQIKRNYLHVAALKQQFIINSSISSVNYPNLCTGTRIVGFQKLKTRAVRPEASQLQQHSPNIYVQSQKGLWQRTLQTHNRRQQQSY